MKRKFNKKKGAVLAAVRGSILAAGLHIKV
jgi:hypothetical protein